MIIAEIGSVHDGSFGNAKKLIELASKCGADAVKFQTHIPDAETLKNAPSPSYFKEESRYDYFKRTGFSKDEWKKLSDYSLSLGITFLSSPFSLEAVDLLESIGISQYKIPSGEVTNIPMLEKIASIGKPVLLSSGMSDWNELDTAVNIFNKKCDLTVMQCSSSYPCKPNEVGLNILKEIKRRYVCKIGYSDHTIGYAAPVAAAALGASVIEKHFTFSRHMFGSDAKHSMEPNEFKILCKSIKEVWSIMHSPVDKNDINKYSQMKEIFQKSIVASQNLNSGTIVKIEHIAFKKPGTGISASNYQEVLGKTLTKDYKKNEMINIKNLK